MASSYYYGGIQIILGVVIAIPSVTIGTAATTVALFVALLLTGLYSLLGSKYLKDAQNVLEHYRNSSDNPVLLPLHLERYGRLLYQFLWVYLASTIILICLSLASFVQGTMLYFTDPIYSSNQGSTPAISGIAALLVNIFISGCLSGDIRRMRNEANAQGHDRPRSPTPTGPSGHLPHRPMEVSTIDLREGEAFPPAYTQIDFVAKEAGYDDLPPPYVQAVALPSAGGSIEILSPSQLQEVVVTIPEFSSTLISSSASAQ